MPVVRKKIKQTPVVNVNPAKCVNCHACISTCPVKYCNNANGTCITINHDLCIGCGYCVIKCSHGARTIQDDYDEVKTCLSNGDPMIALVLPFVAASFPGDSYRFNTLLKQMGFKKVFDISACMELTARSYHEYLNTMKPQTMITSLCPVVADFVELFAPELTEYLAPVDSPIQHGLRYIRKLYPEYADHKIVLMSHCVSKKREMLELNLPVAVYNITYATMANHLKSEKIELSNLEETGYDNSPQERILHLLPAGTAIKILDRLSPGILGRTRRVDSMMRVAEYLNSFHAAVKEKKSPLIAECMNCALSCTRSSGAISATTSLDLNEGAIAARYQRLRGEALAIHGPDNIEQKAVEFIATVWDPEMINRKFINRSVNNHIIIPSAEELENNFRQMYKNTPNEIYNCSACGYDTCENMAIAILHGINRPENCFYYVMKDTRRRLTPIIENEKRLRSIIYNSSQGFCFTDKEFVIRSVNLALCSILSTSRDKLVGTSVLKELFRQCLEHHTTSLQVNIKGKNGTGKMCLFSPSPLYVENNTLAGYYAFITPVSK
ncbi:MAG: 4Fe-4S binding protein [Chitinivibrionales bacterium]|nr:4Fe-4S binding protein [Chitinivibrionales bacterium]